MKAYLLTAWNHRTKKETIIRVVLEEDYKKVYKEIKIINDTQPDPILALKEIGILSPEVVK